MNSKIKALAGAATLLLAAAAAAVSIAGAAHAAVGCRVTYTVVGQWPGGFQGGVRLTNLGDPLTGWSLGFAFPDPSQRINHGWSASWSQSGAGVSAASLSWNGNVATGQSVDLGFIGAWSGANPVPNLFTVNGVTCNGSTTPTTSPPPTSTRPPTTTTRPPTTTQPPTGPAPALRVSGNRIVTSDGRPYRLLGVNRSSGEYACVQGKGQWDFGPVDQASVDAMKSWNIRAVRLPLNEECWLGINGSPSGAAYQQGVRDYVNLLVANGINVILDLHWNSGAFTNGPSWHCTDVHATCQKPVPDAQFAPQFWTGVANAFKGNNAVVFDLFNEPYPEIGNGSNQTLGWQCLRDGGTCTGIPYEVAGMQDLVDAVRATGATNIVMVSGLEWTNDMRQWLAHKPIDPTGNLVASWHAYSFNRCANIACWDSEIAPLASQVPVVLSEFGQDSCGFDYVNSLLTWADAHGLSHLPWTWNPWGSCMILIRDWTGTPEPGFGEFYRTHLLAENPFS
jgi:endoglucanase